MKTYLVGFRKRPYVFAPPAAPGVLGRWRDAVVALAALALTAATVSADVVVLPSARDNTLYEDPTGQVSNGAGSAMFAGRNSQPSNSIRRALLAFDVAGSIPPGSIIEAVSLALYNDAANASLETVELRRVTQDWGEGTSVATGGQGSGAPATPGDATWLHAFYDTDFWANPGGVFAANSSASALIGGPGAYTWNMAAALVADAQSFLDDPQTNFGWALVGNEAAGNTAKRFATREAVDAAARPALTVTFTPIPEPSTFMIVAGGAIWVLRAARGTRRASLVLKR